MGVDVHCYAEVSLDSRWQFAGEMIPNPEHEYDPDEPDLMPQPLFQSCHRELAAILTDSGNPIRSSIPYTPVVPPRGLPPDLSAELAGWLRRHEGETCLATNWFTGANWMRSVGRSESCGGGRWSSLASRACSLVARRDSRWRTGRRVSRSVTPDGSGTASRSSGWSPTPRSSLSFTAVCCPGSRAWAHPIRYVSWQRYRGSTEPGAASDPARRSGFAAS